MSPAGITQVDWPLRAPRTGEAECAGRVAKLMTRHRPTIDRDRLSPVSCAEGSGVRRPAGRRHSSGTGGRVAAGQDGCFQALERTKGPGSWRSYAASPQHNSGAAILRKRAQLRCFRGGSHSAGTSPMRSYAARPQHSSSATGLRNRREATCFRAFSGSTGASRARSYAAAWRHNSVGRESADDDRSFVFTEDSVAADTGAFGQKPLFSWPSRGSGQESPTLNCTTKGI